MVAQAGMHKTAQRQEWQMERVARLNHLAKVAAWLSRSIAEEEAEARRWIQA